MRKTIAYILVILMGVQIALGGIFFMMNFMTLQDFAESFYLPILSGVFYLLQTAVSAAAVWYFLGKIGLQEKKYLRGFLTAFLLTVPFLMQMNMAYLTWSAALSAFLWMMGLAMESGNSGFSVKRGLLAGTAYFLYGLLCPDGLWLGGLLLMAAPLFYRKDAWQGKKDGRLRFRFIVFAAAVLIFLTNLGFNEIWPQGREKYRFNSIGYAMAQRFVWPNFSEHYYFWSGEVKAVLSLEDAIEINHRVDAVESDFFAPLEEKYGWKKANELCFEMASSCFAYRTREIVTEILTDFKDYLLLPMTIERNLQGDGTSLTGWNYGRMAAHTPILVKYYYRYSLLELPVLLLGSILLCIFPQNDQFSQRMAIKNEQKTSRDETGKRRFSPEWKLLLLAGVYYAFWYTMRSNIPIDYKQAMPILFIWYLAAAAGLIDKGRDCP